MPRKWRWCFKCNYCDGIEKEGDHHEHSDEKSQYDYDDENVIDSNLSESEADSNDGSQ